MSEDPLANDIDEAALLAEPGWAAPVPWTIGDIVWSLIAGLALGIGASFLFVLATEVSVSGLSETVVLSFVTILVYAGFFAGAYLMVLRRRGLSLRDIGFAPVSRKTITVMFPAALGMLILVGIVVLVTSPLLGDPPSRSEQLLVEDEASISTLELILLLIDAAVVAPFVEELFFRGLIYRHLRGRFGVATGLVGSSALFAIAHPFVPLMPALFVLGAVFAFVAERYQSLFPSVLLHGLNNGVAVLLVGATLQS